MKNLTIGVDFGNRYYLDSLYNLIDTHSKIKPVQIDSVYGAIPIDGFSIGSAREDHRISGNLHNLCIDIERFNQRRINVNYVCNSFTITPEFIKDNKNNIKVFFELLKKIGISGVIIATPMLIPFVKEAGLEIIMSTILHIDSVDLVEYYVQKEVDTIVLSLYSNRDFNFLEYMKVYKMEVDLEILVNEACINPCPWRMQHYIQESLGGKSSYYFSKCYAEMVKEFPYSIISGNFIRPEDLSYYEEFGISKFKITGRTFNYERMLIIIQAYLNEYFQGNLMDLFPIVRGNINLEKNEYNNNMSIDNESLEGFLESVPDIILNDRKRRRYYNDFIKDKLKWKKKI